MLKRRLLELTWEEKSSPAGYRATLLRPHFLFCWIFASLSGKSWRIDSFKLRKQENAGLPLHDSRRSATTASREPGESGHGNCGFDARRRIIPSATALPLLTKTSGVSLSLRRHPWYLARRPDKPLGEENPGNHSGDDAHGKNANGHEVRIYAAGGVAAAGSGESCRGRKPNRLQNPKSGKPDRSNAKTALVSQSLNPRSLAGATPHLGASTPCRFVDLTQTNVGEQYEFDRMRTMTRLSDGSLVVANTRSTCSPCRVPRNSRSPLSQRGARRDGRYANPARKCRFYAY